MVTVLNWQQIESYVPEKSFALLLFSITQRPCFDDTWPACAWPGVIAFLSWALVMSHVLIHWKNHAQCTMGKKRGMLRKKIGSQARCTDVYMYIGWPCDPAHLHVWVSCLQYIVNSWPPWRGCAVTGIWMFSSNGSNVNEICFSQSNRQYSRITRNRERKESNELFFVGLQCMWIEERSSCFGGGLCFVCFFC